MIIQCLRQYCFLGLFGLFPIIMFPSSLVVFVSSICHCSIYHYVWHVCHFHCRFHLPHLSVTAFVMTSLSVCIDIGLGCHVSTRHVTVLPVILSCSLAVMGRLCVFMVHSSVDILISVIQSVIGDCLMRVLSDETVCVLRSSVSYEMILSYSMILSHGAQLVDL